MRFFFALEIPDSSKAQIVQIQNSLQQLFPNVKLTYPEKLHLTIAFLAEQPDDLKDAIINILQSAVTDIAPFTVTPAFIDGFPSLHHAHILWLGVKGDTDKLNLIHERLKDSLRTIDIHLDERRYTPHIAIAKIQHLDLTPELETELEHLTATPLSPIQIISIKLYESIPNQDFHTHRPLAEIRLG